MTGIHIWLEKVEDKGEDATPINETYEDGSAFLAVVDGMGGAGSRMYKLGDARFTGAWFSARLLKSTMAAFVRENVQKGEMQDPNAAFGMMGKLLQRVLREALKGLEAEKSGLRSQMLKRLPSTVAGLFVRPEETDGLRLCSLSAGDARAYVLRPDHGLQQVTQDHLQQDGDAMDNLSGDSPISNCINADTEFELECREIAIHGPAVLLAASDGCFDYLNFPGQFEFYLLDTLQQSSSSEEWQKRLADTLGLLAADDVSLAAQWWGWESWEELRMAFSVRHAYLLEHYQRPLSEAARSVHDATEADREAARKQHKERLQELWEAYKIGYEGLLKR